MLMAGEWNVAGDLRLPPDLRVLVVDDNEDAAKSLGLLLEMHGPRVLVVHDGISALDAIHRVQPHAILLDLGMPEMDGCEVARVIRQDRRCEGIQLLALTGWGNEECRRMTADAGFDHHLVKPVDLPHLIR
ncbi:MAG TPA: response regulator, partial [Gemmatimonadales bacterium]|nr:response regulator [Gemmatimonadales bacterium]